MHEYNIRLKLAIRRGLIDAKTASKAWVIHEFSDYECASTHGRHCDCDAEVIITTADGTIFNVLPDGSLRPVVRQATQPGSPAEPPVKPRPDQ